MTQLKQTATVGVSIITGKMAFLLFQPHVLSHFNFGVNGQNGPSFSTSDPKSINKFYTQANGV